MESYKWLIAYKKGDKWFSYKYVFYYNKIGEGLNDLYKFNPDVEQIAIRKVSR